MELNELLDHYDWSRENEQNMAKLRPHIESQKEDFVYKFYEYIEQFDDIEEFLHHPDVVERHQQKLGEWFVRLTCERHNEKYIRGLFKIGLEHVRIGLPPHYMNATFTFIREYINAIIVEHFDKREDRAGVRQAANRILDINMDVINMSYREEELRKYLSTSKYQKILIGWASNFSFFMDLFLTFVLVILAILIGAYSIYEIYMIFSNPENVSKHVLGVLGNLLILWAISELLEENIKHLRGGRFAIKIFVSVGLAAIVREILIVSLSYKYTALGYMTATLLALGIVYYLMAKTEQDSQKPSNKNKEIS